MNTKLLTLLVIIGLGSFSTLYAQKSFIGATGGSWSLATNWSPSGVPAATDDVTIPNNKNVTVDIAAVCKSFTISGGNNSNAITIGDKSLTVTGAVTISAPTTGATKIKTISISTGSLSCASIAIANTTLPTQLSSITITSTGIITVSGNFAMSGNSNVNKLNIDNGGTLNVGGTLSGGGFSSTNNNSIVNFNGTTAQTIPVNTYNFNNIITSNTSATGVTLGAAISTTNVTGNITVQSGILNNGGLVIVGNTAKTFTVANGATFKVSGTTSAFPSGFGTNTLEATSTVEYSGSGAQTIFDVASPGYGHLTLSTSGTKTATAGLDIQGNVTVNSGPTLVASNFTHNIGGSWLNNGIFNAGTSTINFNGTATGKNISGTITGASGFNNLTFNGVGGGWTIANNLDIANTLTITNGTIGVSGILSVAGTSPVTVASGGNLTLENNASLIQSGYTGANSGNINVKRNSTPIILDDYTYWSSPTNGTQTLLDFSPATQLDKFFKFNNSGWLYASTTEVFVPGIGYAFRSPEGISTTVASAVAHQFTGVPNNGNIDVAVTLASSGRSYKLIGNPYPSAIDANAFISTNLSTTTGTLYFWTHNHGLDGNKYLASDYAVRNLSGGTAVATGTGNTSAPTQYITSGQGFFVETIAAGNVSFTNTMRTANSNSNFYKSSTAKTILGELESHRIWLNLTNSTASFNQILVGYIESATDDYNPGFDGLSLGSNQHILYSLIDNNPYAIQARALPFMDTDLVPLGFKVCVAGDTTISIDHVDGLFLDNQNIYLEDKFLNVIHDLKQSPYTFTSEAGTFNNRFVLRYVNSALGVENFDLSNSLVVASRNHTITIKSQTELISQVTIYDILGRQIYENKKVNSNEVLISDLMSYQTLIIKAVLTNGQRINKKLVY